MKSTVLDEAPAVRVLDDFVAAARAWLGEDLASVVLFGSAAEGALRPESDVNVVLVLKAFPEKGVGELRGALRAARAAARLEVMFLLESELADAAEAFAVKFADIGGAASSSGRTPSRASRSRKTRGTRVSRRRPSPSACR